MKRRDSFIGIPLTLAGAALAGRTRAQEGIYPHHPEQSPEQPHTKRPLPPDPHDPLPIRYTKTVRMMLDRIRRTQGEDLMEASYVIADTVMRGRTVWCRWDMGHDTRYDMFPGRCGVPEIITMGYDPALSRDGDTFLASIWRGPHADLEKKDIFVIGGPAPYSGDAKRQDIIVDAVRELRLKPYADIWIETDVTTEGAIMRIPGMPAPHGPVSGIIGLTTYWMILADACRILSREGRTVPVRGDEPPLAADAPSEDPDLPLMDRYFDTLMRQIELIGAELGRIGTIAEMAMDTALSGGMVYCYSHYENSLCAEGHHRRGGLAMTRGAYVKDGILISVDTQEPFSGTSKDLVVMGILSPDDPVDLEVLDILRKQNVKVASLGPMVRDAEVPTGRTVPKETDVHVGRTFDTYGLFALPGFERKVCPTSGAVINQIWWATCMALVEECRKRTGEVPAVYYSAAIRWGREHNRYMNALYRDRGY